MSDIRISCASLASVTIDGKYLLLLNKRSYKEGRMVYTPIGGGLEYLPNGKKFLDNLGAKYERETPDLRLKIDSDNIDLFKFWFEKGIDREIDIFRELKEEIVDEENIIQSLSPSDLEISYIKTETPIIELKGVLNHFFFEIYDVSFSKEKTDEIKRFISKQGDLKKVLLVTEEEIRNGLTSDKIEIGSNTKSILK